MGVCLSVCAIHSYEFYITAVVNVAITMVVVVVAAASTAVTVVSAHIIRFQ